MKINDYNYKEYQNKKEITTLRITCILGSILSPLVAIVWSTIFPVVLDGIIYHVLYSLLFSIIFLILYLLTYKSRYVKYNAYYILYGLCYILVASTLYFCRTNNFSEYNTILLLFTFSSAVLIIKNTFHHIIYAVSMVSLAFVDLYTVKEPHMNRENTIAFLVMYSLVSFVYIKSKQSILEALKKSEEHYRNLVEVSPLAIIVHQQGKIVYANPTFQKLTGALSDDEVIEKSIYDLINESYSENILSRNKKAVHSGKHSAVEEKLFTLDGRVIEVESNYMEVVHQDKPAVMSIFKDITERKTTERKLVEAESRYRRLVESALVGVFLYQNGKLIYANPYLEKILGYTKEELYNMNYVELAFPEDRHILMNNKSDGVSKNNIKQFRVIRKDGSIVYVEIHDALTSYNGIPTVIGTLLDITHIKRAEDQIKFIAYHDALTGLPNRYMLNDQVSEALQYCKLNKLKIAILFIDLDRFKIINDTLGHSYGDVILKQSADRIKSCVRRGDAVSRYGGDEFVIVMKDINKDICKKIAFRIIEAFRKPFGINGQETYSTPSIGISFFPDDGDSVETLLKNADAAMYLAKEKGKNNYQFYNKSINKVVAKKMELENGLRKALNNNEFILYYQPQIDLKTGKTAGIEALIRWKHPTYGLVPPSEFIPLSEETGLIIPMGEWVLETACRQNKMWQENGCSAVPIAVNVSGYQLKYSDFASTTKKILDVTGLDPQYLTIEITESVMQDMDITNEIIKSIKSYGVKVAIDDFGTGFSSISLLKNLPIDIIKIDPSFIRDFSENPNSIILTKFIIDLAHELNYSVIAEGVENESDVLTLKERKCDLVQGYYFSRPVPPEGLETILER